MVCIPAEQQCTLRQGLNPLRHVRPGNALQPVGAQLARICGSTGRRMLLLDGNILHEPPRTLNDTLVL